MTSIEDVSASYADIIAAGRSADLVDEEGEAITAEVPLDDGLSLQLSFNAALEAWVLGVTCAIERLDPDEIDGKLDELVARTGRMRLSPGPVAGLDEEGRISLSTVAFGTPGAREIAETFNRSIALVTGSSQANGVAKADTASDMVGEHWIRI